MKMLAAALAMGLMTGMTMGSAQAGKITVERVFSDPGLSGPLARGVQLSPDGKLVTWIQPKKDDQRVTDLWAADLAGGEPRLLIDANSLIKGKGLSLDAEETRTVRFRLRNVRLKPDLYTAALWLGVQNLGDIDGIRYATTFRMEARREDILYTPPFPGVYVCEFDYDPDARVAATQ